MKVAFSLLLALSLALTQQPSDLELLTAAFDDLTKSFPQHTEIINPKGINKVPGINMQDIREKFISKWKKRGSLGDGIHSGL